jgi:cell wall-associated NlpC family hydrolase
MLGYISREERENSLRRAVLALISAVMVASGLVVAGIADAEAGSTTSYSQVVDNATEERFKADEDWGTSSYGRGVQDDDYRFARPAEAAGLAQFKIKIPEKANYAVYARWPQVKGGNDSTPIGVVTSSGPQWTKVNQQRDGGRWVKVGVYEMEAGDDYSVVFSHETSGEDYVIADAIKVEYDSPATPPKGDEDDSSSDSSTPKGRAGKDVVKEARAWIGIPYRLGGQTRHGVDCSGLTMLVYKKFGVLMPHWDEKQYRMGVRIPKGEERPGDLVFFNEHGKGISHVGIYAGKGKIVHASDYFNKVTESQMKYIKGYVSASRMLVNGKPVKQPVKRSVDPSPDEASDASAVASEKEASPPPTQTHPSDIDKEGYPRGSSSSTGSVSQKTETSQRIWVEKVTNPRTKVRRVNQPSSVDPKAKANTTYVEVTKPNEHEDQERRPGED